MPILFTALPLIMIAIGGSQMDMGDATDIPAQFIEMMVSSRVSDPRTAEQVSLMLVLPLLAVFFRQILGAFVVNVQVMQLTAVVLVAIDAGLVYLGVRAFQRETILTKWK